MVLKVNPNYGYQGKIHSLISLGRFEEAKYAFENEIIKLKLNYQYFKDLGVEFWNNDKYAEALMIYEMMIKVDPNDGYLKQIKTLMTLGNT